MKKFYFFVVKKLLFIIFESQIRDSNHHSSISYDFNCKGLPPYHYPYRRSLLMKKILRLRKRGKVSPLTKWSFHCGFLLFNFSDSQKATGWCQKERRTFSSRGTPLKNKQGGKGVNKKRELTGFRAGTQRNGTLFVELFSLFIYLFRFYIFIYPEGWWLHQGV